MKKIIISLIIIFSVILIGIGIHNIDITLADTTNFSDYIISKWQTAGSPTTCNAGDSGIYKTNNHEYRYIGADPDNYVLFNDDLYQIIGVFDKNSYDRESVTNNDYGDYLIKLISADKLMATAWGIYNDTTNHTTYTGNNNNWTGEASSEDYASEVNGIPASANILLNTYFLNPSATSEYGTCANLTYYFDNNDYKTKDCSKINRYGIQTADLRNYIEEVTWYLYGYTSDGLSKANWYQCERGNYTNCTSANSGKYKGTASAKIGLMYVSDYMYASGYYESTNTTAMSMSNYYFANQNWLHYGLEWTITPIGKNTTDSFYVSNNGNAYYINTYQSYSLRPTFYLKSSVYVTGGTGRYDDPYEIACDNCNS